MNRRGENLATSHVPSRLGAPHFDSPPGVLKDGKCTEAASAATGRGGVPGVPPLATAASPVPVGL